MKLTNTFVAVLSLLPVLGVVAFVRWGLWCRDTFGYTVEGAAVGVGGIFAVFLALAFISDVIRGDREEDEGGW